MRSFVHVQLWDAVAGWQRHGHPQLIDWLMDGRGRGDGRGRRGH